MIDTHFNPITKEVVLRRIDKNKSHTDHKWIGVIERGEFGGIELKARGIHYTAGLLREIADLLDSENIKRIKEVQP